VSDEQQEREFGGFSGAEGYDGPLEDGKLYSATLVKMVERFVDKGQWPGWKVFWTFAIEGREKTIEIESMTSEATGEGSTAGPWLISLVGRQRYEERLTRTITKDELVGRECAILVNFNDRGWPRVTSVIPRQARTSPPPPVAPPPATGGEFDDLPF